MDKQVTFEYLVTKVEQHEKVITQLVEIIGTTNQMIAELANKEINYLK